jgi:hypothetical protein
VITKFVYAAVAAVLLAPVPALAGDLGPPGYYGDDSYDDYAPATMLRTTMLRWSGEGHSRKASCRSQETDRGRTTGDR